MVITLDRYKKPLGFTTERRARILLTKRRACVYRYYPFTIIIKDVDVRDIENPPAYEIKVDPGSEHTGIAIRDKKTGDFVFGMQIKHRARTVKSNLETRKACRRNRRSRETLYRHPKFKDGDTPTSRANGRLPPSVKSIIGNTEVWIKRLSKLIDIDSAVMEDVRIDTQLMDDPAIEGKAYQHGTLLGYEMRQYLLDRYQHRCQYCGGASKDPALEWEHKIPKSRGGSDSIKNATLACHTCNQEKGSLTPGEWAKKIQDKAKLTDLDRARLAGIKHVTDGTITGGSNRYCAWTNNTRKALEGFLVGMFPHTDFAGGGMTRYNRTKAGLPKDHQYDAYCAGHDFVPGRDFTHGYFLEAGATGRGTHFRGKTNACGVITKKLGPRQKRMFGFMNGDIVKAVVPHKTPRPYKCEGVFIGRVMTRASGSFDIRTADRLTNAGHKYCTILQHANGYQYRQGRTKRIPLGS